MSRSIRSSVHVSDIKFLLVIGIILLIFPFTLGIPLKLKSEIRLADPKVLAFYYTWYGNTTVYDSENPATNDDWMHWNENSHNPPSTIAANHTPSLGVFDSADNVTIEQHISWAEYSGIDGFIATWWGRNTLDDYNFRKILAIAERKSVQMNFTLYFESVQPRYINDWTLAVDDIEYIIDSYGSHPYFLTYEGQPVIFLYAINYLGQARWTNIVEQLHEDGYNPYLIADIQDPNNANNDWLKIFDGYHTYNPAGLYNDQKDVQSLYKNMIFNTRIVEKLSMITVIPGYNDFAVCNPEGTRNTWFDVPRRNGDLYEEMWDLAINLNPDWILICTFNEWHEGSEIEPSIEYGTQYIEATKTNIAEFKS
jgi:glycoprotein endo-alpha-1,2-mannosidase